MNLHKTTLAAIAAATTMQATAYDFACDGLYYNIIDSTSCVEVTRENSGNSTYSGTVIIPGTVTDGSSQYTVTRIASSAFIRSAVTDVQIAGSVAEIGDSAFCFAESLANVTLPPTLTTLSQSALSATAIEAVCVPEGVATLGKAAFQSCQKLHTVFLPSTMETIESYGFNGCTSLAEIYCLAETPPAATAWAIFIGLTGIDVVVNDEAVSAYKATEPWSDEETFTIYPSEPVEVTINVSGKNDGDYDVLTLGENIAYKIYQADSLVAITAATRYYLPADGLTYKIVPTNFFNDADTVSYTTTSAGISPTVADSGKGGIYAHGGKVYVEGGGSETVEIYTPDGVLRYRDTDAVIEGLPRNSVYIARRGAAAIKIGL